ncbi:MAG TPA: phospholipase D-like domain-containing protein, partial [Spirochaetia bacterium]|nr:phospholipase D-like domain-containing protein [Spirochaetia bacterium]
SPAGLIPAGFKEEETLLVSLLDGAIVRIDIQLLVYSPVQEGGYYAVLDNALRRAAGRGVAVRVLVSNWNLREPDISHLKSLALVPGIQVAVSTIPQHSSGFIPFARVEHCKYLLVDESKTWIATGNWSSNYFHVSRNLAIVFDEDGISATVSRIFNRSWNSEYAALLDPCRSYSPPEVAGGEARD